MVLIGYRRFEGRVDISVLEAEIPNRAGVLLPIIYHSLHSSQTRKT